MGKTQSRKTYNNSRPSYVPRNIPVQIDGRGGRDDLDTVVPQNKQKNGKGLLDVPWQEGEKDIIVPNKKDITYHPQFVCFYNDSRRIGCYGPGEHDINIFDRVVVPKGLKLYNNKVKIQSENRLAGLNPKNDNNKEGFGLIQDLQNTTNTNILLLLLLLIFFAFCMINNKKIKY